MIRKLMIFSVFLVLSGYSNHKLVTSEDKIDYRQEMRNFVIGISKYAKASNPKFVVVPQNGVELVSTNGSKSGRPHVAYLNAIDANGQEELFYGYDADNQPTNTTKSSYFTDFLNISKKAGKSILVIDYCKTPLKVTDSYSKNRRRGYVSFAADKRELNTIPDFPNPINSENNLVIADIKQAKNFLYLINPEGYTSKKAFINAVASTNYDVLVIDLFFSDDSAFTLKEINQLKKKANGGKRMVLSYMSIGEAENYRFYWRSKWDAKKPNWLKSENPNWPGNFKVKYWNTKWQNIIYGNDNSYLKKIIDSGFDGVYLDLVDAFEYYE